MYIVHFTDKPTLIIFFKYFAKLAKNHLKDTWKEIFLHFFCSIGQTCLAVSNYHHIHIGCQDNTKVLV